MGKTIVVRFIQTEIERRWRRVGTSARNSMLSAGHSVLPGGRNCVTPAWSGGGPRRPSPNAAQRTGRTTPIALYSTKCRSSAVRRPSLDFM